MAIRQFTALALKLRACNKNLTNFNNNLTQQFNMTEDKIYLKKIEIIKNYKMLRQGLKWEEIPPFAVITGINGSGKSQLLELIANKIANPHNHSCCKMNEDPAPTAVSFPSFLPSIDPKLFNKGCPVIFVDCYHNPNLLANYVSNDQLNRELENIANNIKHQYQNYQNIEKEIERIASKEINTLSDKEIKEVLSKMPIEAFTQSLNNLKIAEIFLRYYRAEQKNRDIVSREDWPLFKRKEKVSQAMFNCFKIDKAPWELINDIFKKYNFKHRINKPESDESYNVKFLENQDGETLDFSNLSSGEKVIVQLILWSYDKGNEGIGNNTSILLLDEFDAHLNPTMSKMFIEIIDEILVKVFNIQVIMTTHSPSTVAYVPEENLFWMEDGKILQGQNKKDKMEIIHTLATGFIQDSCPFFSYLIDPAKPYYIIVEGYTDVLHIKTACKKLGGDYENILKKCNFINLGGTKGVYLEAFISNFAHNKQVITVLDNDKSGNDVFKLFKQSFGNDKHIKVYKKDIKIAGVILKTSDSACYIKDYEDQIKGQYIPIELLYSKDVLKTFDSKNNNKFLETYGEKSTSEVSKHYNKSDEFITNDVNRLFYIGKDECKYKFAKEYICDLKPEEFKYFKPTLDLIVTVIKKWSEPENSQ